MIGLQIGKVIERMCYGIVGMRGLDDKGIFGIVIPRIHDITDVLIASDSTFKAYFCV